MAVLYNMDVFSVLKILYRGKTDGFSEEDFMVNEKQRGIVIPPILKKFLSSYGYMTVNRFSDSVRFVHPNIMSRRSFIYGSDNPLQLVVAGRVGEYEACIAEGDVDPQLYLFKLSPDDIQILPSEDRLSEIFKVMTVGLMFRTDGTIIAEDPGIAVKKMKENGFDLDKVMHKPNFHHEYSICFSEERRTFMAVEFADGEYERFIFLGSEKYLNDSSDR